MLEEIMIRATAEFGISARREPGRTGIWVEVAEDDSSLATRHSPLATSEKLGAIGVHISRWVTSHGFAYNVATDLRYFDLIVPCGIAERKATSLEKLLGRGVGKKEVAPLLAKHFGEVFGLEMRTAGQEELFGKLEQFEQPVAATA
jgi:lipoyl(octanoyl) transferase